MRLIANLLAYSILARLTAYSEAVILSERDVPLVSSTNYDFVIVGGGTAGNVVANRLTENPDLNVLVLEAGPSDAGVLEIQVPFLCTHTTPKTTWDWNYTTIPQVGLNGASLGYPRGHVLGGSSSINCLVYTRGSKADFNRYASVTDDSGWSWDKILPYFKKSEKFTPPSDRHNTTGQFDPSVHGFDGLNSISLPGAPTIIDDRFNQAIDELGGEFTRNLDTNSGSPIGFGWSQAVIDGPTASRSSSSSGYLARHFLLRPNLHVLVNAQVSKVLPTGNSKGTPEFKKVEYRLNGGTIFTATASKEVILSAGSINTPQILLNSGIGNTSTLNALGITPRVNLPDVGQNLSDHPIITLAWRVNSNATYDDLNRNTTRQAEELQKWKDSREGAFVNGISQHIGFVRLPNNSSVFQNASDPSAGEGTPHFEIFVSNFLLGNTPPEGNFLSISTILLTPGPLARGSVTLNNSNPFGVPVIDAGLLADPHTDLALMREAVKSVLRLASAPAWKDYILGSADDAQPELDSSDQEIEAFVRQKTRSAYHVVGTSSMSKAGKNGGVVDPSLKVKGAQGLRVIDASVLPFVPAGHCQAATYALAERGADLIKKSYT